MLLNSQIQFLSYSTNGLSTGERGGKAELYQPYSTPAYRKCLSLVEHTLHYWLPVALVGSCSRWGTGRVQRMSPSLRMRWQGISPFHWDFLVSGTN